jgi:hypothetical protein
VTSTFSPIGDISFLLILPRSVSPMNKPIVSSSRRMSTNGSHILHALILARGMFPSMSLMICLSLPSTMKTSQIPKDTTQKDRKMRSTSGRGWIHTRFKHAYGIRHNMQNRRALEERPSTDRSPWYTRRNSQISLCSPHSNLNRNTPERTAVNKSLVPSRVS